MAGGVEAGAELVGGVDPSHRVGAHRTGIGEEVLGRHHRHLQQVEGKGERRRGRVVPCATAPQRHFPQRPQAMAGVLRPGETVEEEEERRYGVVLVDGRLQRQLGLGLIWVH